MGLSKEVQSLTVIRPAIPALQNIKDFVFTKKRQWKQRHKEIWQKMVRLRLKQKQIGIPGDIGQLYYPFIVISVLSCRKIFEKKMCVCFLWKTNPKTSFQFKIQTGSRISLMYLFLACTLAWYPWPCSSPCITQVPKIGSCPPFIGPVNTWLIQFGVMMAV